ncbi:hypothetical protein M422DRAFT_24100 [Sphaerobolus stellatus SS14]|nr:hypothetical protein M422DRAFT_24100 [Sphaerobolus stellatus SS14]
MAPKENVESSPRKTRSRQTQLPFKSTKRGAVPSKAKGKAAAVKAETKSQSEHEESEVIEVHNSEDDTSDSDDEVQTKRMTLDPGDKAGLYKRYYKEVKKELGPVPPIHSKGQSKVYKMLRVFDNTYDYGPCVGLTRLERWERAEAMNLNPPPEVRDILLTEQGRTDPQLIHPVFYGQVV